MTSEERRTEKSWTVLGPGAVGLYYGGLLAADGNPLRVLGRSDFDTLRTEGIRLRRIDPESGGVRSEERIRPAMVARRAEDLGPADWIIIAAKAGANENLADPLRQLVVPGRTVLLTLQNGMGNADYFADLFPGNPVLAGLCFVCVNRTAPGVVENYLPGRVAIGSAGDRFPEEAEAAVRAFASAGVRTELAPCLEVALWRKLSWNVPFNGLAIVGGGVTTDRILGDTALRARARRLMEEIMEVGAAACGWDPDEDLVEKQFAVTEKMGAYRPSSLIDYLAGGTVEVEPIWGRPLRRAEELGVETPELEKLYGEIREALAERNDQSR